MHTLRGRISAVATLVVAVALVLTGAVIVGATGRAAEQQLRRDLTDRLEVLQEALRQRPPLPDAPLPQLGDRQVGQLRTVAERTLGPGFFLVIRRGEQVLLTLGDAPEVLPDPSARGRTERYVAEDGTTYLVQLGDARAGPLGVTFQIGADVDQLVGEGQRELRNRFLLVGALATVLTGAVTFGIAGIASRPLARLRDATSRVAETEDLTTRVDVADAPNEITEVAEGLNTMLARLERSRDAREAALHAARRFAADAGHELRTPLTAMQSTLDTLERNPSMAAGMQVELVAEVAEESRRLSALLDSLQTLARADAGLVGDLEVLDLVEVAGAAVAGAATRYPDVSFELAPGAEERAATVVGAEPWLRSVVDNLLRNAAVHGRHHGRVVASVSADADGWVRLAVDDDGPGIPSDLRETVFQRFTRGADAGTRPGSGLGLALVAQLVALHGGAVRITDSPLGGARVEVALPARGGAGLQ